MPMAESDPDAYPRIALLVKSLEELGWRDGKKYQVRLSLGCCERRPLSDRLRSRIGGTKTRPNTRYWIAPGLAALRQETRTLPIVFLLVVDPVGIGFVNSLARPGGNITGITNFEPSIVGKWLEMLKEIAPRVTRILFVFDPDTTPYATFLSGIERFEAVTSPSKQSPKPVHNRADIEAAIVSLCRRHQTVG